MNRLNLCAAPGNFDTSWCCDFLDVAAALGASDESRFDPFSAAILGQGLHFHQEV
jgi:hypothetical protein